MAVFTKHSQKPLTHTFLLSFGFYCVFYANITFLTYCICYLFFHFLSSWRALPHLHAPLIRSCIIVCLTTFTFLNGQDFDLGPKHAGIFNDKCYLYSLSGGCCSSLDFPQGARKFRILLNSVKMYQPAGQLKTIKETKRMNKWECIECYKPLSGPVISANNKLSTTIFWLNVDLIGAGLSLISRAHSLAFACTGSSLFMGQWSKDQLLLRSMHCSSIYLPMNGWVGWVDLEQMCLSFSHRSYADQVTDHARNHLATTPVGLDSQTSFTLELI